MRKKALYNYKGKLYKSYEKLAFDADVSSASLRNNIKKYPELSLEEAVELTRKHSHKIYEYDGEIFPNFRSFCEYTTCHPLCLRNAMRNNPDMDLKDVVTMVLRRKRKAVRPKL